MLNRILQRRAQPFVFVPVVVAALACGDAVGPVDEPEVQIATVVLTQLTDTPTYIANGGSVTVTRMGHEGAQYLVFAGWLDSSGQAIPAAAAASVELRITGATFSLLPRTTFAGWIIGLKLGPNVLHVVAWHTKKAHAEFEGVLEIVISEPEPYECDHSVDPWCY